MYLYGKTASNAIAVMSYLAACPGQIVGSAEIAEARGISRALTAKLLTQLSSAGLVQGQPGPGEDIFWPGIRAKSTCSVLSPFLSKLRDPRSALSVRAGAGMENRALSTSQSFPLRTKTGSSLRALRSRFSAHPRSEEKELPS